MKRSPRKRKQVQEPDDPFLPVKCECGREYYFPLLEEKITSCNSCLKEEYRKDAKLNRFSLEEHAEIQHEKLERWWAVYVEMKDIYYSIEQSVKQKKAELDGRIRLCDKDSLEKEFGIPKLSEASILMAIERHREYTDMVVLQRKAWKRREILNGAVEEFRDRSSMIKVLKELFVSQYFDRTGRVTSEKVEAKIARATRIPK